MMKLIWLGHILQPTCSIIAPRLVAAELKKPGAPAHAAFDEDLSTSEN